MKNKAAIKDVAAFFNTFDEKVQAGRANDGGTCDDAKTYDAMKTAYANGTSAVSFPLVKSDELPFNVVHYAGQIKYSMLQFCAKSRDELDSDIAETMRLGSEFVKVSRDGVEEGFQWPAKRVASTCAAGGVVQMTQTGVAGSRTC